MRLLYLIRHATPAIRPEVPPRDWLLSERGIEEAAALAATADSWGIEALYASSEPKAQATALIMGDALGLLVRVVDAFDELIMGPEWITNADAFNEQVRAILEDSGQQPRSAERAPAAAERFAAGVAIARQDAFPAAIVSHGRILAAYLSRELRIESPFEFWREIPMPGWACLDLDGPRPRLVRPFTG